MNRLLFPAAGFAVLISSQAFAAELDQQAAAPSVADRTAATALGDIVVTANRSAQSIDKVGASVTVLTAAALEASQATAVPDALARTPGVSFARNGGIGTVTSVNIRGAEGHHTVVLIDGVKMNDPSSTQGGANFSNLLVGDLSRIEVLRGAQSTLWGSQAIGGVVNIITAEPTQALQGYVSAEAGSFGTRYFRGAVGGTNDRFSWRVAANRYDTDGYSAFAAGTENDGYSQNGLSGRMNLKITDAVSVDLRAVWSDGTSQFDSFNGDSREYSTTQELASYAGLNFDLLDGRLRNRIGFSYTDTQRDSINPDRLIEPTTFEAKGENKRLDYQGSFAFTDNLSAVFGIESERAEMRSRSLPNSTVKPAFGTGKADQDSAYVQLQWEAVPGINLTAGVRYDDHARYGDKTLGQFAAAWTLNEGKTVLRASWAQGFRAPGLYELYSEYGNLDLQPEAFDAWEVSVQQRLLDRASLGITYFNRQSDNEIRYKGCSFGTTDPLCTVNGNTRWGYYENIQKTEAQGIEVTGAFDVTSALRIAANYTWTDAINASGASKGKRLTQRPEHMANLSADYAFASGLKTGVAVRYAGKAFANAANSDALDAYTLVDLRASYPVNDTLEVYGRIENLFDEQYQVVRGYGTADRSVYGGVRIRF
ncbi:MULTISPECIES: TonB-dependent receptor plug domain-containing protein [unclassified Brevundimonas]|uniref:TonB-dependent receptor plug domain-containing protein n=1 Tax=unclassified Brevundimonas TaxID=2622653 RepID=UPI0025C0A461|nr:MULTISPECIES: TonB-dependent receptor [unclassified Brevundimonas]